MKKLFSYLVANQAFSGFQIVICCILCCIILASGIVFAADSSRNDKPSNSNQSYSNGSKVSDQLPSENVLQQDQVTAVGDLQSSLMGDRQNSNDPILYGPGDPPIGGLPVEDSISLLFLCIIAFSIPVTVKVSSRFFKTKV